MKEQIKDMYDNVITSIHMDECEASSIIHDLMDKKISLFFKNSPYPVELRYGNHNDSDDKTITIFHNERPVVIFTLYRDGYNYTILNKIFLTKSILLFCQK